MNPTASRPWPAGRLLGYAFLLSVAALAPSRAADFELWSVGADNRGQFGDGVRFYRDGIEPIATDVKVAVAGYFNSAWITRDGTLWMMGRNQYGQNGDGTDRLRDRPTPIARDVASVSLGGDCAMFVKTDGTLWAVGFNGYGGLGIENPNAPELPVLVATDVAYATIGREHSAFIKRDGTLWTAGRNDDGQLGRATPEYRMWHTPGLVASGVRDVCVGFTHTLFVKDDGTLWGMGENPSGALGDNAVYRHHVPTKLADDVVAVAANVHRSYFVKSDGTLWGCGNNSWGQLGDLTGNTSVTVPRLIDTGVASITAIENHAMYRKSDGTIWGMGDNDYRQLGVPDLDHVVPKRQVTSGFESVSTGATYSFFLKDTGELFATGIGFYGVFGDGQGAYRMWPVRTVTGVAKVWASSDGNTLTLMQDGSLWGMGKNPRGQLGTGEKTIDLTTPAKIADGVIDASITNDQLVYLRSDHSLWLLGTNFPAKLFGLEADTYYVPTQLLSGVKAFATDSSTLAYIEMDDSLWTVGDNFFGQLGVGSIYQEIKTPSRVAENVIAVQMGMSAVTFIKADRTLWGMGDNSWGQLGLGRQQDVRTPTLIASDVVRAKHGDLHTLFTKSDRSLWGTGNQSSGQLGDGVHGAYLWRDSPAQIASDVIDFAASHSHSAYVTSDGNLWAMGANYAGELGLGHFQLRDRPQLLARGVVAVAAGDSSTLFLRREDPNRRLEITRQPASASLIAGSPHRVSVEISGTDPLFFEWFKDGILVPLAASSSLEFAHFMPEDAGAYTVVVRNVDGMVQSATAELRISPLPGVAAFTPQETIRRGLPARFEITPHGGSDSLQWEGSYDGGATWFTLQEGAEFSGTTTRALVLTAAGPQHDGLRVRCAITSAAGTGHSPDAQLTLQNEADNQPGGLWVAGGSSYWAIGSPPYSSAPRLLASDIVSVSSSHYHSLYVDAAGTLWAVGANNSGQLGDGTTSIRMNPVPVATDVTCVAAGQSHSLFIKRDGSLWGMGDNSAGQLGDGSTVNRLVPIHLADNVRKAAAGASHSLFLLTTGELFAVGYNREGALGDSRWINRLTPVLIAKDVVDCSAGMSHSLFVTADSRVWATGFNEFFRPTLVGENAQSCASGGGYAFWLSNDGGVYETAPGLARTVWDPAHPPANTLPGSLGSGFRPIAVASGGYHYSIVTSDSTLWTWGMSDRGQLCRPTVYPDVGPLAAQLDVQASALGMQHTLFIKEPASAPSPDGRPINLSVRSAAGIGADTLIAGFAVEGPPGSKKTVLIRAAGPALERFHVPNFLENPSLVLYDSAGNTIASNDDWDGALEPTFAAVSAFRWQAGSKDAAMVVEIPPGTYTAHVLNGSGEKPEVLVEVYDVSKDTASSLSNLSCRTTETPGQTVIAGVVFDRACRTLVRHSGPALQRFGVADCATDTAVAAYQGSTVVSRNDDWDWSLARRFARLGAFSWRGRSKDSALVLEAAPGSYTIHCSVRDHPGVGLVEIYRDR